MAFVVPNISESIKYVVFWFAMIIPVAILAWVYTVVSSFQATLQEAQRKQRICGTNVFERETVRHVAYKLANQEKDAFGLALLIIGLIAICACAGSGMYFVFAGLSPLNLQFALVGIAFFVMIGMAMMLIFDISFIVNAKKDNKPPIIQEYSDALNAIKRMFKDLNAYLATNKNSTWETYRLVLAKRVARENNLPSIEEAEGKVLSMLTSDRDELLGYVEFDLERDYNTLKQFANTYIMNHNSMIKAQSALEKLASPTTFDPLPAYQSQFDRMYLNLGVLMTAVSLIWLIIIRNRAGLVGVSAAFFFVVIVFLVYSKIA